MTIGELEGARADAEALREKIEGMRDDENCGPQTARTLNGALDAIAEVVGHLDDTVRIRTGA